MSSTRVMTSTSGYRAPVNRRNRQQEAAPSTVLTGRNRQQEAASSTVLTGRNRQQEAAPSTVLTGRNRQQRAASSAVLAGRNQAVVAVGAWVECGEEFVEHPEELALLTEEIQAEKRRENEESLRRFQDEVRHRVAQRAHVSRRRRQPQAELTVKADRRIPPQQRHVWTQHVSAGAAVQQRSSQKSSEGMKQVRLRLASCRMMPRGEVTSDLPGGEWNVSPTRHRDSSHTLRAEQEVGDEEEDVEGEEEEEEGDDHLFTSPHECPLVQQKVSGHVPLDSDRSQPVPGPQSSPPWVLWPQTNQEELKRERLSQFLKHRRLYMNIEREQVKENKQHRKHLKRTASIKAEKEQIRLEEERELERARQLAEARQKLEERELLILERLRLEEEERAEELQRRRRREEKGKVAARFIEALRAQMKERLSQEKLEPPPLCCCASSFWDSHPDTCANNCVFHNNPKAYAKALHSTMLSLDAH